MCCSCRNICKHRSFCANGCPAILFMKPSSPLRRSSMNESSKSPSSPRNGNCRFHALPGRAGTTIYRERGRQTVSQWWGKGEPDKRLGRCLNTASFVPLLAELFIITGYSSRTHPPTLLSRSNSLRSHSKSLYRRITRDSFTLNTGRFVWNMEKRPRNGQ